MKYFGLNYDDLNYLASEIDATKSWSLGRKNISQDVADAMDCLSLSIEKCARCLKELESYYEGHDNSDDLIAVCHNLGN